MSPETRARNRERVARNSNRASLRADGARELLRRPVARRLVMLLAALVAALAAPVAPALAREGESGGGGETTELGNNLSFPVIWSDGENVSLPLPGVAGAPELPAEAAKEFEVENPETEEPETIPVWPQATEGVTWQAGSEVALAPVGIEQIDWGDNIEAKSLSLGKPIRVETTLFAKPTEPLEAFEMVSEGERQNETFYTTGKTSLSDEATVYSGCARLTIQRLLISREDPYTSQLSWDPTTGEWVGKELIAPALFNGGVWEEAGGGTGYSAEINASGKVLYGYNWRTSGLAAGDYRITFSLDPNCPVATLNTYITEATSVLFSEEGETAAVAPLAGGPGSGSGSGGHSGSGGVAGGGVPQVYPAGNLSYVDVELGNPIYTPYVPPEEPVVPKEEVKTVTTTTAPAVTVTSTTSSKTGSESKEQARKRERAHVAVTLHKTVIRRTAKGAVYRFFGTVSPRRDHQRLRIQRRTKAGWRTVAVAILRKAGDQRSRYSLRLRDPMRGVYRAWMVSNDRHFAGASKLVKLRQR